MVLYKVNTILVNQHPTGKKTAGMLPASWKMQLVSHQPARKKLTFLLSAGALLASWIYFTSWSAVSLLVTY